MSEYGIVLEVAVPIEYPYTEERFDKEFKRFERAVRRIWPNANIDNYEGLQKPYEDSSHEKGPRRVPWEEVGDSKEDWEDEE